MDKQIIMPPYKSNDRIYMGYIKYMEDLSQSYIRKFYEAGYITSREYNALHEALNKTTFDDGYMSITIYVDDRELKFVCVDDTHVQYLNKDNIQISACITVCTSTGEPDFSVTYSGESDTFYVSE